MTYAPIASAHYDTNFRRRTLAQALRTRPNIMRRDTALRSRQKQPPQRQPQSAHKTQACSASPTSFPPARAVANAPERPQPPGTAPPLSPLRRVCDTDSCHSPAASRGFTGNPESTSSMLRTSLSASPTSISPSPAPPDKASKARRTRSPASANADPWTADAARVGGRLDAEAGYGVRALGGVATPLAGFALTGDRSREWRAGGRFALAEALDLALATSLRESRTGNPDRRIALDLRLRW